MKPPVPILKYNILFMQNASAISSTRRVEFTAFSMAISSLTIRVELSRYIALFMRE